MANAADIISSIFKHHENEVLQVGQIEAHARAISLRINNRDIRDADRAVRGFAQRNLVERVGRIGQGFYRYDHTRLNPADLERFNAMEDVYIPLDQLHTQPHIPQGVNPVQGNGNNDDNNDNGPRIENEPVQTIYYGVPGCGKSRQLKSDTGFLPKKNIARVVFHPDYSNADFIGQILPETNGGNVFYRYKASPFVEIIRKAYLHQNQSYALVIEEINRGNAPAIFGEIFQLLDRLKEPEDEGNNRYDAGWSEFPINNSYINAFIRGVYDNPPYAETDDNREIHFHGNNILTKEDGIRLPKNLSIYATMNTSDQNVFTLDNAFQRRWKMHLISNDLNDENQANAIIEDTNVSWGVFRDCVNREIVRKSNFTSLEDKRLGGWFVETEQRGDIRIVPKEIFEDKVLKYLWDDAFKLNRDIFKNHQEKTLETVINDFEVSHLDIFSNEFLTLLNQNAN